MQAENFIQDLLDFVNLEDETQKKQVTSVWARPINERVLLGEAIDEVIPLEVVENDTGLRLRKFRVQSNISKFRIGDYLLLHTGNIENPICYCQLYEESGLEIVLQENTFKHPTQVLSFLNFSDKFILDKDLPDIGWIIRDAMNSLTYSTKKEQILNIVFGKISPKINAERMIEAESLSNNISFNEKQREAFVNAFSTENFYVIQGPPGTGKTFLLAQIAYNLAIKGEKVLITSFTHRAINNALVKIAKILSYNNLVKIGDFFRADDLKWDTDSVLNVEKLDYLKVGETRLSNHWYNENGGSIILGGSIFHLHTKRLQNIEFDTIIFDEAGQISLPNGVACMMAGKKCIFIGDHKQMSPIIQGSHSKEYLKKSVFETIFQHNSGTMLDTTYRMNGEITEFPSNNFYGGKLKSFSKVVNKRIVFKNEPQKHTKVLDKSKSVVFVDLAHENRDMRSNEEALFIVELVQELLQCGIPTEEIAVIAPYRAQGRLIRQKLFDKLQHIDKQELRKLIVDTVERIQGQEREVIIISLTTSNPEHALQKAEFYFHPNRLNVAITRAKTKLVVVGSKNLFNLKTDDNKLKEWINYFKEFYNYSHKVTVGTEE